MTEQVASAERRAEDGDAGAHHTLYMAGTRISPIYGMPYRSQPIVYPSVEILTCRWIFFLTPTEYANWPFFF